MGYGLYAKARRHRLMSPGNLSLQVEHLFQLGADRAVIGIGRHHVAHMLPPALADVSISDRVPALFGLDLHGGK